MRSIIIDAVNRNVREHEHDGNYRAIQAAVGGGFDGAGVLDHGGAVESRLYVHDDGLLNGTQDFFFLPLFYPQPLAGNGIIVGMDGEGETVATPIDIEMVRSNIRWLKKSEIGDDTWDRMSAITITAGGNPPEVVARIPRETAPEDAAPFIDKMADEINKRI